MAKYISNRQQNLKIGIVSYTEDKTVLEVIGKVGIGSTAFNPVADLDIRGSLNVRDTLTVGGNLSVAGIGTINTLRSNTGIVTTLSGTNLNYSGITTLGLTSTTNLTSQQLFVSGLSTFSGITTHTQSLFGTGASFTGIITATSFSGDGSQLTGVTGTQIVTQDLISTPVFLTFANNAGVTSLGIATTGPNALVFIPSTGNLGIGTTNPTSKLTVVGDGYFTGIITANSFVGTSLSISGISTLGGSYGVVIKSDGSNGIVTSANPGVSTVTYYGDGSNLQGIQASSIVGVTSFATNAGIATNVIGGIASVTQFNVSGISTLGTVKISSGIITASSGIVTYFGDGSNLQGIQASSIVGVTSFATNAGIATNLKGGLVGNVPYQSATDTTAFLINGSSGTILQSNGIGNAPSWVSAAPAAAITGLTIRDEGTIVGGASSVSELNFVGAIVSVASTAGIATITFLDYVSNAGIATFATNAGIATFATNAGIATFTSEWILGAVGSSDYTFTGPGFTGAESDPVLYLVRGQQYKFTNIMGAHPFRIQSTVNGSTGTQYNDGIVNNDVSNGTLTWNVQFDAPGLLYYQCTAHGSMGGKIYIIDAGIGPDVSVNTTGIITAASFSGDGSQLTGVTGIQIVTQDPISTPVFLTFANNAGVTSLGVVTTGSNSLVFIPSTGNLGIGTTNPTSKLTVVGDVLVSGVVTASNFVGTLTGNVSSATFATNAGIATFATTAGIATFATNAGIATNLKGGVVGNIPYQSAIDTTVFLTNGSSGTILQSNGIGNAPSWVSAAPAAAITGLTIRDEGTIVGGANSVSQLNFVGPIVSVASTAGIATITFLDYVSNAGIATFATNAGISTNVIGGIGSITQLQVTGISTFTNGPVFIGSGTSTGTASQPLQVTGGAYVSGNLGIGTTNPTSKLHVIGDVLVSGILTANRLFSGLYGEFVGGSISGTAIVGTSLSITGISTFTNGPVFIGSGTSTGTASQPLQVTGGAYVSGNLGIGTTNPRANLDVTSSILLSTGVAQTAGFLIKSYTNSSGLISFEDVDNTNSRFSIDRDTSYLFKVNDTGFATKLIVDNSGNLGVGTTVPTSKLHIIGDVLVSGILTANRLISNIYGEYVGATSIVGAALSISGISTFSNGPVFIGAATSTGTVNQRLQVTGGAYVSGNLGIGTTNPRANLDVTSSILLSTGVAQTAGFLIKSYTNSSGLISFEDVDNTNSRFSIDRDTSYLFKVNDTGFATKLIVDNSGNLGVGTTVPTSKLHVIGNVNITGSLTKGSGTFVIPHPILQDKNLVHSFVESPRADLIYRGVSPMVNGIATVMMDEYIGLTTGTWKLLCREPQIFLQNNSDFSLVKGNIDDDGVLTIISNTSSNCNIDWMVVSERQDEVIKNANWTDDNGKPILEPYK